ncbi:hypothetical protein L6452_01634 [Arctium lappa]|uniref:Uncharacterized protein n=1 Tax=Arctium lappa TaxID=4217 RepID=A0ACB9FI52_ARCLA|nr:hypothetical protein L6452_01634 [Arctium lappa]
MDADSWAARLSSTSKRYQYALQSRSSDMFMGFEDIEVDDDIREEFPCPFCTGYFDIVGLCCHIDDEHHVEAKNGTYAFVTLKLADDEDCWVFSDRSQFFLLQFQSALVNSLHANVLQLVEVSHETVNWYPSCLKSLTKTYMQQKRKCRKGGSVSTLSLLRRELREGNLQSLFGGSSYVVPSANAAPDPLLSSFILPISDDLGSTQSNLSVESVAVTKNTSEKMSERYVT